MFIYLFGAVLDFCHCTGFSPVAARWGHPPVAVHGSQCSGFSCCRAWTLGHSGFSSCNPRALENRLPSCGACTQLLHGMWDLPGPGTKPVSPALAGRFFTTEPPGQPHIVCFFADGDTGTERQDALLRDAQPSGDKLHPSM